MDESFPCQIVAIQEVVVVDGGPDAVQRLHQLLQSTDTSWQARISASTSGEGTERYAFLWRGGRVTLTGAALSADLQQSLDREPFIGWFAIDQQGVTVVNFHAVPTAKDPAHEIVQLPNGASIKGSPQALLMGGFNLAYSADAFDASARHRLHQSYSW